MRLYDNSVVMTPQEYKKARKEFALPVGKNNEPIECGFAILSNGLEGVRIFGENLIIYIQDENGVIKPNQIHPDMGIFMTELEFALLMDKNEKEKVWHKGEVEFVNEKYLLCVKDTTEKPCSSKDSWKEIIIQN